MCEYWQRKFDCAVEEYAFNHYYKQRRTVMDDAFEQQISRIHFVNESIKQVPSNQTNFEIILNTVQPEVSSPHQFNIDTTSSSINQVENTYWPEMMPILTSFSQSPYGPRINASIETMSHRQRTINEGK